MAETPSVDIVIPQGGTFYMEVQYQQIDGEPMPLSGWNVVFEVHPRATGGNPIVAGQSEATDGTVVIEPIGIDQQPQIGLIVVRLGSNQTALLKQAAYYRLVLVDLVDTTEVIWLLVGKAQIDLGLTSATTYQQDVTVQLSNETKIVLSATGPRGPRGLSGEGTTSSGQPRFTGTGPPGVIIGAEPGDEYLDKSNGDIYTLM